MAGIRIPVKKDQYSLYVTVHQNYVFEYICKYCTVYDKTIPLRWQRNLTRRKRNFMCFSHSFLHDIFNRFVKSDFRPKLGNITLTYVSFCIYAEFFFFCEKKIEKKLCKKGIVPALSSNFQPTHSCTHSKTISRIQMYQ